jgi:hypothetical protein
MTGRFYYKTFTIYPANIIINISPHIKPAIIKTKLILSIIESPAFADMPLIFKKRPIKDNRIVTAKEIQA